MVRQADDNLDIHLLYRLRLEHNSQSVSFSGLIDRRGELGCPVALGEIIGRQLWQKYREQLPIQAINNVPVPILDTFRSAFLSSYHLLKDAAIDGPSR